MTQSQKLYTGVSRAAWGYIFLYFDIKLGNVSILPSFVGIFLFLSAVDLLQEFRRDLSLLRPLGTLLALWHIGTWIASWFGITLGQYLPVLSIIVTLASMYFHFQLLTDLAALAKTYQTQEELLDRRILKWRTLHTLLLTVSSLISYPLEYVPSLQTYLPAALAVLSLFTSFCIMSVLFDLRRLFRENHNTADSI